MMQWSFFVSNLTELEDKLETLANLIGKNDGGVDLDYAPIGNSFISEAGFIAATVYSDKLPVKGEFSVKATHYCRYKTLEELERGLQSLSEHLDGEPAHVNMEFKRGHLLKVSIES